MARRPIFKRYLASRGHLSPQEPRLPWSYPVLAHLSVGYPGLEGRLPTCYSPVRRFTQGLLPFLARLACVRHAASVRSEPGSNSPVKLEKMRTRHRHDRIDSLLHTRTWSSTTQKSRCSSFTTLGPVPHICMRERGRYYLVFKDRLLRGDPLL